MRILGKEYRIIDTFDKILTVPDCFVLGKNKLGKGHGEKKFYFSNKDVMRAFYGDEGFSVKCFILKEDLIHYLQQLKDEYLHPSQEYIGKAEFPELWEKRIEMVKGLDDILYFTVTDQVQIEGPRGYVNSKDENYNIIRQLSLPLVTYISAMKLSDGVDELFYWKLFVDFDAIAEKKQALVFKYGKAKDKAKVAKVEKQPAAYRPARKGQDKFREALLEECSFCPITMVNDDRLLIASHIKPWAVSTPKEQVDPNNGFMLSPLYDALFDKGFITFTDDRHMKVSNWLSPRNQERLHLKDDEFIQRLPINDERKKYLEYHRKMVYKG